MTIKCPHCKKPIEPAKLMGQQTSAAKAEAARRNGAESGGRPVGAKDSKPRKRKDGR